MKVLFSCVDVGKLCVDLLGDVVGRLLAYFQSPVSSHLHHSSVAAVEFGVSASVQATAAWLAGVIAAAVASVDSALNSVVAAIV